jgi:hypothetical protein
VCPDCANKKTGNLGNQGGHGGHTHGGGSPQNKTFGNAPVKATAVQKGPSGCRNCDKPVTAKKTGHGSDHYCDPCGKGKKKVLKKYFQMFSKGKYE